MKDLMLTVETAMVNLFSVGIQNVPKKFLIELCDIAKLCSLYKISVLSDEIFSLCSLLERPKQNEVAITEKILYIIKCVDILNHKIGYDELLGTDY